MNKSLIGVFDAIRAAISLVRKNLPLLLIIGIGSQLLLTVVSYFILAPVLPADGDFSAFTDWGSLLTRLPFVFVVSMTIGTLVALAQVLVVVKTDKGEEVSVEGLFNLVLQLVVKFAVITFLVSLVVIAGSILLLVPGIIFATWFFAAIYFLVDQNVSGVAALKASRDLVKGYTWDVFMRFFLGVIILIGVSIAISILTAPLALFSSLVTDLIQVVIDGFVSVVAVAYSYIIYKSLKEIKSTPAPSPK